jgi:molecular chaperone GrpE
VPEDQDREDNVTEEDRSEPKVTGKEEEPAEEELAEGPDKGEDEQEPVDELAALRQELEEARAKEAEYLDGWQRARAELANARKRFQREQEQAYTNARAGVFAYLLPITDDFERAFETLPDNLSSLTWIEGMRLIQYKFQRLLEQEGVELIAAVGQEFDPFFHEAVTHEPSETVPEGHVIAELQAGYKLGDRVLRPSVVRVSSGSPSEPEPPEEAASVDEEAAADDELQSL